MATVHLQTQAQTRLAAGPVTLGIDVGSTTVKIVVLDDNGQLLAQRYVRSNGRPRQTLLATLHTLGLDLDPDQIHHVGFTGSGGGPIAELLDAGHVNELIAQTRAVSEFHPEARTVIEIGGQDSKLLLLERDPGNGKTLLVDFAMNTLCAAGTGSFLDQQAERLGIRIEDEFAALALQAQEPARIAGRCTVFAKSDMIHLQQKGIPLPDILAGLCYALARNFRSVIGRGKEFRPPILFQGGVACNQAVVRAFEDILGERLIIPQHHTLMAALGAAFEAQESAPGFGSFAALETAARAEGHSHSASLPPLRYDLAARRVWQGVALPRSSGPLPVALGIDVGSISTNLVLLDENRQVLARRYLRTGGQPLEAVRYGLASLGAEVGAQVEVRSVGVTGSGRYLTGYYVGADVVRNEITAQAAAAIALHPDVDTVFEIGGQDSKYIRIERGAVVDFTMNKACAAGTGSFLEEQADRLAIDIESDFSRLALSAACPAAMGERCTVFIESDLIHHQQQGAQIADLTAGLAYSVATNFLNKVVNGRPIGKQVLFQGGVATNTAVVAAFEQLLGYRVIVPPHHDVTGAIGAALLAQEERQRRNGSGATRFKGFDLRDRAYTTRVFECKGCPNQCEVSRVTVAGEPPLYYGARCERYEEAGRGQSRAAAIPDLFAERLALLLGDYDAGAAARAAVTVGIPRSLIFYDLFPYWRAFFQALGVGVVLSETTHPRLVAHAAENAAAETCFPVKVVHGHVLDLLDKGVDFVFLPGIIDRENVAAGQTHNTYCPFIQTSPWLVAAQLDPEQRAKVLRFPVHLQKEQTLLAELHPLAEALGLSARALKRALAAGKAAQADFYTVLRRRGADVLAGLDGKAAVLVGRPYNTNDPGVSQDLPHKVRKLGVLPLPMDFLPLTSVDISARYDNMFWRSGQDILAAAQVIRNDPRLHAIYLTNFACGPDSFLMTFFRRTLEDKPFLELELDDHNADAGVITRVEAFFDSLGMGGSR